jgi:hypothetical protein
MTRSEMRAEVVTTLYETGLLVLLLAVLCAAAVISQMRRVWRLVTGE